MEEKNKSPTESHYKNKSNIFYFQSHDYEI